MKHIRVYFLFLTWFASVTTLHAQTQQFSFTQYMDNLTPLNPAYSLLDQAGSVNTMARKQWVGIDGAPTGTRTLGPGSMRSFEVL